MRPWRGDRVLIQGLRIETLIGVYPEERLAAQTVILDLDLAFDTRPAASNDRVELTLDYHAIALRLRALAAASECQLLETLAERMADCLLAEYPVQALRIKLSKPGPFAGVDYVGVELWRER